MNKETERALQMVKRFAREDNKPSKVGLVRNALYGMSDADIIFFWMDTYHNLFDVFPIEHLEDELEETTPFQLAEMASKGIVESDADLYFLYNESELYALTFKTFREFFIDENDLAWYIVAENARKADGIETADERINEYLKSKNPDFPLL